MSDKLRFAVFVTVICVVMLALASEGFRNAIGCLVVFLTLAGLVGGFVVMWVWALT